MAQTNKQNIHSEKRKLSATRKFLDRAMMESGPEVLHAINKNITLFEDSFGALYDSTGKLELVRRFTWKNHNKIEVQVITYGARITSLKVPNRAGFPEDVALGFENLSGYMRYEDLKIGGTIGRTTNAIANATFMADGQQFWVSADAEGQHCNGGIRGFDKVNWTPYVNGNQLVLMYCSRDLEEGYPGDLLIKITFELTETNELKIDITANATKTTPVDIANILYFNLAGHEKGEKELLKHVVMLNSNSCTPVDEHGFPTGEIRNVIHTRNDFQTPKVLKKMMGLGPNSGYNEHFCINRGVDQTEAFVARVTHPSTGRIIEVYSNNYGVNFNTAEEFGTGLVNLPPTITQATNKFAENDNPFLIIKKLQMYMDTYPELSSEQNYLALQSLIRKLLINASAQSDIGSLVDSCDNATINTNFDIRILLKPHEMLFLEALYSSIPLVTNDLDFLKIKDLIGDILIKKIDKKSSNDESRLEMSYDSMSESSSSKKIPLNGKTEQSNIPSKSVPYKDGKIHGKGGVIYKRRSGMCLRTQNYPNATYHNYFPTSILKPHETYNHTITYKFWVLAGSSKGWLKRIEIENDPCLH